MQINFAMQLVIYGLSMAVGSTTKDEFIWISAGAEGLTQHLTQLNNIRNQVVDNCQRKVLIAPYLNKYHNKDFGDRHIILCDYFIFPNDTSCLNEKPPSIIATNLCITPCNGTWECHPIQYGILNCHEFSSCGIEQRDIDFCIDSCGLVYGHVPNTESNFFHIDFQPKYYKILYEIKELMEIEKNSTDFTVVHWRRGDQMSKRCQTLIDSSVNCKSSLELIEDLQHLLLTDTVYISTNEKNITELENLSKAGYHTWNNLGYTQKLNSVEVFIIELMLMTDANIFLHWGHSTVGNFADLIRKNRQGFFI